MVCSTSRVILSQIFSIVTCESQTHTEAVFILLRVSASFVAILGRKDAYTLWSWVAMTHISCIIARVFAVNIGKVRRILFQNQRKGHIYCLFNPIPPCFLAFKCLNLIGRAETALSNHTSFNKNSVFINRKHVYSKWCKLTSGCKFPLFS